LRVSSFPPSDTFFWADTRPPAMSVALALSFKLFGVGLWQARLPSYVARTGAIALVFLLGVRYAGLLAGLLAAVLLLSDNYLFVSGRTVRPEAMVTFFFILTLWLYHQARERKSLLFTLLASLAAAGAMAFHVIGAAAALSLGILLLLELRLSVWKSARAWCFAAVMAITIGSFVLWIRSDPAHYASFRALYVIRASVPYGEKVSEEMLRYEDFLGFTNQRFPLPVKIPIRIHIAAAIVAAFLILRRVNRTAALDLAVCAAVTLLWFTFQVNKTARYFSICAPMFALLIAIAAVALLKKTTWTRTITCALALVLLSQLAGNALLLYSFRKADYGVVTQGLRTAIPQNKSAYGLTTFWLALNDRTYYAYDRAPFGYAISALRPDYLILNDRVMMYGSGYGTDDFKQTREQSNDFAHRFATLVATIPSPFYGKLEVFHVCYSGSVVRGCASGE
jgi:4-amino-4-deoxy-L-arabinose transferase-like glycosyltransferase